MSSRHAAMSSMSCAIAARRAALSCLAVLTAALALWSSPVPTRAAAIAQASHTSSATSTLGAEYLDAEYLGAEYLDATLGFSLRYPAGWSAEARPGTHAASLDANVQAGEVILRDLSPDAEQSAAIEVAVTRGAQMPALFASRTNRGIPTQRLGAYPAFAADLPDLTPSAPSWQRGASQRAPTCRVYSLLAGDDYVIGQACGLIGTSRAGWLEAMLATYTPGAVSHVRALAASARMSSAQPGSSANRVAAQPQNCAQLVASATSRPADTSNWGRQLVGANDPRWNPFPLPGVAVCSNFTMQDGRLLAFGGYLFQCVELANRFLREQWGHGSVDGNAAMWFDYADATGARRPGTARIYPDMQLSDDAGQGISAFRPGPGDILVWQDVRDGASWTSGLRASTGHVAVITGTDAANVYFMQQNYSEQHAYMSLPMSRVANGWHISDTGSGVPGRIVRGWIHVAENGGPAPPPSAAPLANAQDVYAVGVRGTLANFHLEGSSGLWASASRIRSHDGADQQREVPLVGTPSVATCRGDAGSGQSIFAIGRDGDLNVYTPQVRGAGQPPVVAGSLPAPGGVRLVGSPSAVCHATARAARPTLSVFATGDDGHLYRYARLDDGTWTPAQDLSVQAGGPLMNLAGAPSAVVWEQGGAWYEAAYVVGSDEHLYEFRSQADQTWHRADLTAPALFLLGTDVPLLGTPSAYVFTHPGSGAQTSQPQRGVFVTGANGDLYAYTSPLQANSPGDGGWFAEDVSRGAIDDATGHAPAAVRLLGSPSAHYAVEFGVGRQFVVQAGGDGHIYAFGRDDVALSAWRRMDLSATAGQPATTAIVGSPVGYSYTLLGDPRVRHSVFAMTADGHLAQFSYLQAATPEWTLIDRGESPGSALGAAPAAIAWMV